MRIGHFSDLHGNLGKLLGSSELPDVWVCSGDFFPNATRGDRSVEVSFQAAWFKREAASLITRFGGKPVIWVGGNHDYVNLAELLRENGYAAAFDATVGAVEFEGHRFAGMDSIPWIAGEWRNEEHDLTPMVERVFAMNPTILITHAPPAGILDAVGYGVRPLTTALAYQPHQIVAHLFGHAHENGGQDIEEMGVRFYNGAECLRFITVG
jgi:Icc-related predicted phosphoesterase